jgi:hypothetical protein
MPILQEDLVRPRWSAMIHVHHDDYETLDDEVHRIGAFLQEQQATD